LSSPERATDDADDGRRERAEEERRSTGHEAATGGMKWGGGRVLQGAGGCGRGLYSRCPNDRIQRQGGGHPMVGWEVDWGRELGLGRLGGIVPGAGPPLGRPVSCRASGRPDGPRWWPKH
jgi:hypothetical protein